MREERLVMRFLCNPYVESVKTVSKVIYFFLCMSTQTSRLGIVSYSRRRIALETGVSVSAVNKGIAALVADGQLVEDGQRLLLTEYVAMDTGYEELLFDTSGKREALLCLYEACSSLLFQAALQQRYPKLFSKEALSAYHSSTRCVAPSHNAEAVTPNTERANAETPYSPIALAFEEALTNEPQQEASAKDAEDGIEVALDEALLKEFSTAIATTQSTSKTDATNAHEAMLLGTPASSSGTSQRRQVFSSLCNKKRSKKSRARKSRARR